MICSIRKIIVAIYQLIKKSHAESKSTMSDK